MTRATLLLLMLLAADARPVRAQVGLHFTPLPDVTVLTTPTLVRGANGSRYTLNCTNTGSNDARLGDSVTVNPPSATKGVEFLSGATIAFTSKSALVAIAVGSVTTFSCSEETQ